jgi:hypothetical protein
LSGGVVVCPVLANCPALQRGSGQHCPCVMMQGSGAAGHRTACNTLQQGSGQQGRGKSGQEIRCPAWGLCGVVLRLRTAQRAAGSAAVPQRLQQGRKSHRIPWNSFSRQRAAQGRAGIQNSSAGHPVAIKRKYPAAGELQRGRKSGQEIDSQRITPVMSRGIISPTATPPRITAIGAPENLPFAESSAARNRTPARRLPE